jgi:2-polyprenyl-3-methyl-5-hydroxy-6-metoxy-1,4-benzoquinol methylase
VVSYNKQMKIMESRLPQKERFAFGKNWLRYLTKVNERRITEAEESLKQMLEVEHLRGSRFLDVGCGSGLFSLAARRMGATVHSFDIDPFSIQCTANLRDRFSPGDQLWTVERGSVLDKEYVESLGGFDIVYSWGVLHHTGEMWKAVGCACAPVKERGLLYIAIYNQQDLFSSYWRLIKRAYSVSPSPARLVLEAVFVAYFLFALFIADIVRLRNPFKRHCGKGVRGMDLFIDVRDWIGGYPFEVAKPEEVVHFLRERGFVLRGLKTVANKHGCNEYLFIKSGGSTLI